MGRVAGIEERSLAPELSLVDVLDDLIWQSDGKVTLVYRVEAYHEAGLDDEQVNSLALQADNAWSSLPEESVYQFYVLVSHRRAVEALTRALPPIADDGSPTSRLLDEIRERRLRELIRVDVSGASGAIIQERRHFLCVTWQPAALQRSGGLLGFASSLWSSRRRDPRAVYEQVLDEAITMDRRIVRGLTQQGLGFSRCTTPEIIGFVHEVLNPSATEHQAELAALAKSSRGRDDIPASILEEFPYLGDVTPVWSLVEDDLLVRKKSLLVGDRHVTIISLKELPETTSPGMLVPLIRMARDKYRIYYRLDIPKHSGELGALRSRSALADGLKLQNFLVKTDRTDPHAAAVARQTNEAMERLIGSNQRSFGICLQITLAEKTAAELEEAVSEVLGTMSHSHGLRGYRETFLLKQAWLAQLPGAPALVERRRKELTRVAVDMQPVYDFRGSKGKVPFATRDNAVTFFDPFDASTAYNANVLITGTSGVGKSVAAQVILSGYEIGCACGSDPMPHIFVLDNGASYRRFMDCRPDGRYVPFSFAEPPGVDVFAFDEVEGDERERRAALDEHISRLEWLLLDLLKVDTSREEEAERKKASIEQALYTLYSRKDLDRTFGGFAKALEGTSAWAEFETRLFPYTQGKFDRLLRPNPRLALTEDVHAICYDFHGLAEHPDLSEIALRLVIYEIRRFSARMSRKRRRSFLVLDESWALLDRTTGGKAAALGSTFLASSLRMGRKEGLSVIALSQSIEDFALSAYGAAIVGNSATKLIGPPGREGVQGLRQHLQLTERQVEQTRSLVRGERYQEFLLIQGNATTVIRVGLDPLSRWLFTTLPTDKDRLAALATARPELAELERVRLLTAETESLTA